MGSLTGTGALIRLILRRDRIKLPLWIAAIAGMLAVSVPALKEVYGTTQDLLVYASTTASSVAARMLGGPVDGPNIGSVLMVEYFVWGALAAAFMSTLAIVRHTRQNEETGRSELIGSLVVGRHAALTAALIVVVGANLVLTALIALAITANNLPGEGALAMAAGIGGTGIVSAAIAAILVQVTESARSANAMAAAAIGAVFLVRGLGDALGKVAADGLSVTSSWLSWLSPIGWGQQMHPFGNTQLWPMLLFVVLFAVLAGFAFRLTTWRDVGAGLRATRPGPTHGAARLLKPAGLAWRLQRGVLIGWAVGAVVFGVTFGVTSVEFQDLLVENEQFIQYIEQFGSSSNLTDLFFSGMIAIGGITLGAYGLQALQRLRSEEAGGQVESVLAGNVSRPRWMLSHIGWVIVGIALLVTLFGVSTGVSYVLAADAPWSEVARLSTAAWVQVPAMLVLAGLAIAVFGALPKLAIAVTWSAFAFCLILSQFGGVLNLPQWVMNISPFTHTPAAPAASVAVVPLVMLAAVAVVLAIAGLAAFRRRDAAVS
jgi:ABC-2 type transport system permease protein